MLSGFTHGFPLHSEGKRKSFSSGNLKSALQNPTIVDAKIEKERELQRLASPFESPPLSPFRVSALGVVLKRTPGEYRLIDHLSFPKESSVNDGISSEHTSVKYATSDKAIQLIKKIIIITLLISSKRPFSLIYNVKYQKLSFPKIPLKMLFYFNFKYI